MRYKNEDIANMTNFQKHKLHEIVISILNGGTKGDTSEDIMAKALNLFGKLWGHENARYQDREQGIRHWRKKETDWSS